MTLEVIILAAGKGTRMCSDLPKVLHPLGGRAMLLHVLDTARQLQPEGISVVYGHGGEAVPSAVADGDIRWVLQEPQQGTGHAVDVALPHTTDATTILIMYGDIPMIGADTLKALVQLSQQTGGLSLLTVELDEPAAYGRILRDESDQVRGIVEARDASVEQLALRETNTGFVAAPRGLLAGWLGRLDNENAQKEYYLTDIVALAVTDGVRVGALKAGDPLEVRGVNSRAELAELERYLQYRMAHRLMRQGVTLADPARIDVRGEVETGRDCFFDVNVVLEGRNVIGDRVRIGPNCLLRNVEIADGVQIHANSVLEDARVGRDCHIGPFARVRPGTRLEEGARLGNFVETKNAMIGRNSKINHLSYIGDAVIGHDTNIGAGVITCNYDGVNKHRTVVGDNAFVGSDTQLVAPVHVGDNATVGAGTTLTRDAPAGQLTISRASQRSVAGWRRPARKTGEN